MASNSFFIKTKAKAWLQDISALANPILLLTIPFLIIGNQKLYLKLIFALLINEIVGSVIKVLFPKKRPDGQTYNTLLEKIDAGSFPSLHASRITIAYLTLIFYSDQLIIKVGWGFLIFLVIISRVLLKKHYITDVIGGFAIGILIWYFLIFYSFFSA